MSTYTLALGPFAAVWRGPKRIVFTVEDDTVVDVEYRGGYNERSCAERLTMLNLEESLHLVGRICGVSSHSHTMAFCQALETLMGLDVPERANYLRCAIAEIERLAAHLEILKALFNVLGQRVHASLLQELCEGTHQAMMLISGRRIIPDMCIPGGIRYDVGEQQCSKLLVWFTKINRQLAHLLDQVTSDAALSARTVDVGTLSRSVVEQFELRGPIARAAGLNQDRRLQQPYAAYPHLAVSQLVEESGDVYARIVVLLLESFESVKLIEQVLHDLPNGAWQEELPKRFPAGQASAWVEAPHGMLGYTVESDGQRLKSVTIDPPRQIDRLLARVLFVGALVDNIVLIALSVNPCVACAEC